MSKLLEGTMGDEFDKWIGAKSKEDLTGLSVEEIYLLFFFEHLSDRDQRRVIEFTKITARKNLEK